MKVIVEVLPEGTLCKKCGKDFSNEYGITIDNVAYCKVCGKSVMDNLNEDVAIVMKKRPDIVKPSKLINRVPVVSVSELEAAETLLDKYISDGFDVNAIIEINGTYNICKVDISLNDPYYRKEQIDPKNIDEICLINSDGEPVNFQRKLG